MHPATSYIGGSDYSHSAKRKCGQGEAEAGEGIALVRRIPPEDQPQGENWEEYQVLEDFARRVFAVPKSGIAKDEKKEKRRKARKKG